MKKHYVCRPLDQRKNALVFDWDEDTGEVSGPSAGRIRELAARHYVPIYPPPQYWDLSTAPLKDRADMAAIIGFEHELPEDLAEHYPGRFTPEPEDGVIY